MADNLREFDRNQEEQDDSDFDMGGDQKNQNDPNLQEEDGQEENNNNQAQDDQEPEDEDEFRQQMEENQKEEEKPIVQPKQEEKKTTVVKKLAAIPQGANKEENKVPTGKKMAGQRMENMPFDEAIDVSGSDSVESGKDEDEKGNNGEKAGQQPPAQPGQKTANKPPQAPAPKNMGGQNPISGQTQTDQKEEDQDQEQQDEDEDEENQDNKMGMQRNEKQGGGAPPVGGYNPMDYASLNVSTEVSELFQHITRYHPHNIELDTKLKPFIPDYIPAVGEVDAFLKVLRPDGEQEQLGLSVLDEPTINPSVPAILGMRLNQCVRRGQPQTVAVSSLPDAENNPKQIQQWISSMNDVHKSRPPATVQYSKNMPDLEMLMQEWTPEMEEAFNSIQFPGPEIDLSTADYAKVICGMMDIPAHKGSNKKSLVEGLHLLFSLYAEFKANPHFRHQKAATGEVPGEVKAIGEVNVMKMM